MSKLALESLYRGQGAGGHAVFEEQQGIRRILEVDAAGFAAGIRCGISINAALALSPKLCLLERHREREAKLLNELARWAGRFTSFVILDLEGFLLLEVAGSERLFGSLRSIRQRVTRGLATRGLTATVAIAPTPLASTWFARSNEAVCIEDGTRLVGSLSRLPLTSLAWPPTTLEALDGTGMSTVGDCLRLPRAGFARRFGTDCLRQLDQALGRLPDPRTRHSAPECFHADYEFDSEQTDQEFLLVACQQLLQQFERFMRARQIRVLRVEFSFFYLRETATQLTLGRMQAGQNVDHWLDLLQIKLERIELSAGVVAIRLRSAPGQSSSLTTDDFLGSVGTQTDGHSSAIYLLERFRTRLGEASVHGVNVVAEHRPQYAWSSLSLLTPTPDVKPDFPTGELTVHAMNGEQRLLLRRPLWMLDVPEALETSAGTPLHRGEPLRLLTDAERIESGWWDERGIARDYFSACTDTGMHVWVYRDRQIECGNACWYLQGIFA